MGFKGQRKMRRRQLRIMYRELRWAGAFTGFAIGEIILFYGLIAGPGPVTERLKLILGICVVTAGLVFLIVRRPSKWDV